MLRINICITNFIIFNKIGYMKNTMTYCFVILLCIYAFGCVKETGNTTAEQGITLPVSTAAYPDSGIICPPPEAYPGDSTTTDPYPQENIAWPDPSNQRSSSYDRGYFLGYTTGIADYNTAAGEIGVLKTAGITMDINLKVNSSNVFLTTTGTINYNAAGDLTYQAVGITINPPGGQFLTVRSFMEMGADYQCEYQWLQALAVWPGLSQQVRDFQQGELLGFHNGTTYQSLTNP
jgi:hypothetical protein